MCGICFPVLAFHRARNTVRLLEKRSARSSRDIQTLRSCALENMRSLACRIQIKNRMGRCQVHSRSYYAISVFSGGYDENTPAFSVLLAIPTTDSANFDQRAKLAVVHLRDGVYPLQRVGDSLSDGKTGRAPAVNSYVQQGGHDVAP